MMDPRGRPSLPRRLSLRRAPAVLPLLLVAAATGARADHGGTLQLNGDPVGPYRVSAWTEPRPVRPGTCQVRVAVMQPHGFRPVLDAAVEVAAEPLDSAGPATVTRAVAGEPWAGYVAAVPIAAPGRWRLTVRVAGPAGAGSVDFPLEVARGGLGPWPWAGAGAGAVALAGGWLAWSRRRTRPAAAPAKP